MRAVLSCLGLAAIVLSAAVGDADAQRRDEPQPRTAEPAQRAQRAVEPVQRSATTRQFVVQPATGDFQRRRAADKQATLQQLQLIVTPQQLGESFTLTPRAPYAAQRGSLEAYRAVLQTREGAKPLITVMGNEGNVTVHVEQAQGKRFLIECQAMAGGLRMTPSWSKDAIVIEGYPAGGLFSVVTPVVNSGTVSLKLERHQPGTTALALWTVSGCEVTRFQ